MLKFRSAKFTFVTALGELLDMKKYNVNIYLTDSLIASDNALILYNLMFVIISINPLVS